VEQFALQLDRVCAGYKARQVLQDVSLALRPGRVLAVLGPNGAGKSTLVRVCLGLHAAVSGQVSVNGRGLGGLARRELARELAWVPQSSNDAGEFTALELVLMGRAPHLSLWGLPSSSDVAKAQAALEALGLGAIAARRVSSLSGGERRLVLLCRALVQEPKVLVLDEPTAFLDLRHQVEALRHVRRLAQEGMAALAVLHDVNLASAYADEVLLLKQGRVLAAGPTREVLTGERLQELYDVEMVTAELGSSERIYVPRALR
jgi:iron complex transport system ATP-binding protein